MHSNPDGSVTPEFAGLMVRLAEAWNAELSTDRIRIYARALSDLPVESVRRACGLAVRECQFFPSVAQLRGFVIGSPDDAALVAWAGLSTAASRAGAYASLTVEDGAAAEALMLVFGSWPAFCAMEEGPALGARRQEFIAAYRDARRKRTQPIRLVGLCEAASPEPPALTTGATLTSAGKVLFGTDRPALEQARGVQPEARAVEEGQGTPQASGERGGHSGPREGGGP